MDVRVAQMLTEFSKSRHSLPNYLRSTDIRNHTTTKNKFLKNECVRLVSAMLHSTYSSATLQSGKRARTSQI